MVPGISVLLGMAGYFWSSQYRFPGLAGQENMEVLYVRYGEVVTDAGAQAEKIADFLGEGVDVERRAGACDRRLYRS